MKTIKIKSSLVGKSEAFRILALGYAYKESLPILMLGDPGTGKSALISDFLNSIYGTREHLFSIQLTESSKPSDILGRVDMKSLVKDQEMKFIRPIVSAKGIFIDEVDKSGGGLRNSMLSIMNEKQILAGDETINVPWELFVGSTNTIPTEETGNPFWDRWVIKHKVNDATVKDISNFILDDSSKDQIISIPEEDDLKKIIFSKHQIDALVKNVKKENDKIKVSDRTLIKIPKIAAICKYVWDLADESDALLMATKLVCPHVTEQLMKDIISPEQRELNNIINLIASTTNSRTLTQHFDNLRNLILSIKPNYSEKEFKKMEESVKERIMNCGNHVAVDKYIIINNLTESFISDFLA
jgi:MoxR-like ATPase